MTKKEAEEIESPYSHPEAWGDPYLSRLLLNIPTEERGSDATRRAAIADRDS